MNDIRYGIENEIQSNNVSEADAFLDTLRQDVKDKIIYNVDKVANGYMDKDLFKKLDDTDIWEFRTLYKGIQYRVGTGHRRGNVGHCRMDL